MLATSFLSQMLIRGVGDGGDKGNDEWARLCDIVFQGSWRPEFPSVAVKILVLGAFL